MKLKQGEDYIAEIIVIDEDNKKVDLLPATNLAVGLFIRNQHIKSYIDETVNTPVSGYGHCEIYSGSFSGSASQINLFLERDDTALFPVGDVYANVLIEFDDSELAKKRYEYSYVIGTIEKGYMKSEPLI